MRVNYTTDQRVNWHTLDDAAARQLAIMSPTVLNEGVRKHVRTFTARSVHHTLSCCSDQTVSHAVYLNQTNSANCEIQARIISGNRSYYSCGALMKSRALNRISKLKIYTTLIRTAVTYGCEAWTLSGRNEQQLRIFERKILREIFGPVQDENGIWRIRKNHELNELIGNADIVRFIKSRMAWLGHVMQMDGGRMPRRILEWKPMGRRIKGRPRKRWIEDVVGDIQTMGIRGWRKLSKERTEEEED